MKDRLRWVMQAQRDPSSHEILGWTMRPTPWSHFHPVTMAMREYVYWSMRLPEAHAKFMIQGVGWKSLGTR